MIDLHIMSLECYYTVLFSLAVDIEILSSLIHSEF
jgi:hypothetical protein